MCMFGIKEKCISEVSPPKCDWNREYARFYRKSMTKVDFLPFLSPGWATFSDPCVKDCSQTHRCKLFVGLCSHTQTHTRIQNTKIVNCTYIGRVLRVIYSAVLSLQQFLQWMLSALICMCDLPGNSRDRSTALSSGQTAANTPTPLPHTNYHHRHTCTHTRQSQWYKGNGHPTFTQ